MATATERCRHTERRMLQLYPAVPAVFAISKQTYGLMAGMVAVRPVAISPVAVSPVAVNPVAKAPNSAT
jgi:hypothetical protein